MAVDPNREYKSFELPDNVFNAPSGEIRNFNGQDYKVIDTGHGTRYLQSAGIGGGIGTLGQQPAIDLNGIYDKLYNASGIKDSQANYDAIGKQLNDRQIALNTAQAKINDNPFYSEGTRVGRSRKLNDIYNADATVLTNQQKLAQDQIATQKADVETRLNIQLKQFDINSQQAQQALNQFNVLLQSGALSGANGEDIANITRSTGISSDMIQSAINAQNEKNVQTQTIQFDDGTEQGFVIVNQRTGDIISRQVVAQSAPTAIEQKAQNAPATEVKSQNVDNGGGGLTAAQIRSANVKAAKAIQGVDVNQDKLVSLNEYKSALQSLISSTGVDSNTADNILSGQMDALGYHKWRW